MNTFYSATERLAPTLLVQGLKGSNMSHRSARNNSARCSNLSNKVQLKSTAGCVLEES